MEVYINASPENYYNERRSLVDIIREWEREGLPLEICPPLLEELLLLKFPQFRDNIRRRIEFYGGRCDTLKDYFGKLIDMERYFYGRGRGRTPKQDG